MIRPFNEIQPKIHETAFVADDVTIVGDVEIGDHSSVPLGG